MQLLIYRSSSGSGTQMTPSLLMQQSTATDISLTYMQFEALEVHRRISGDLDHTFLPDFPSLLQA